MKTVTQLIRKIRQPYGGYIPLKKFTQNQISTTVPDLKQENVRPTNIGMVVDYLTRFRQGDSIDEIFKKAMYGAIIAGKYKEGIELKEEIDLSNPKRSIIATCKLVEFDLVFRDDKIGAYKPPKSYSSIVNYIDPDNETINHIDLMLKRTNDYLDKHSGATYVGFTFKGTYDDIILHNGDGDFITDNSLIDLKVSTAKPSSKETMQAAIYYIMGFMSQNIDVYSKIEYLRLFNPRLGCEWYVEISEITDELDLIRNLMYL